MAWVKTKEIGHGSFGSVFMATHSSNPRLVVAIKSAKPGSSLAREIAIMQKLQGCDQITKLYKQINNDHMVLEYASGGSLFNLITRYYRDGMPEWDVRVYTRMLLIGLLSMHERRIVHCDLKPDNILVFLSGNDGRQVNLKIADFGLATDLEDNKSTTTNVAPTFIGTSYYMSPESVTCKKEGVIVKNGVIGTALDIWSLGCVVIEMLSGHMAWGGYFVLEDMERYLVEEKRCPLIPPFLSHVARDFITKCLERDHWKRWTAVSLLRHPFITEIDYEKTSDESRVE